MQFKLSLLAGSLLAALTLTGCNSDSSSDSNTSVTPDVKPPVTVTKGQFIDAKVQGLDYVSGKEISQTDAEGNYTLGTDTISFYLGGTDGLLIGSISGRTIATPFEAAGTYERSINLARLLLTINEHNDDSTIIIPSLIKNNPSKEIKVVLAKITLDDTEFEKSALKLLALLTPEKLAFISAEAAESHMQKSLNPAELSRGSNTVLTAWARGSEQRFVERSTVLRIQPSEGQAFQNAIHADRTLGDKVFNKTVGLTSMQFTLAEDAFKEHVGSNDTTFSSAFAAMYLTCVGIDGELTLPTNNSAPLCNDIPATIDNKLVPIANSSKFTYVITNPFEATETESTMSWDGFADEQGFYGCIAQKNCSEKVLSQYAEFVVDDSDEQDDSQMQRELISGSYDPVTDVYTQTRSKTHQSQPYAGRTTEYINFIYPVDKSGVDRYVDFTGTWTAKETRPGCDDVATSTLTFDDSNITLTGQEFSGSCDIVDDLNVTITYADFAKMDFWWFGTNNKVSTATLDQLNTTVRWNDKDTGKTVDNFKINRFSYIPAGKAWDQGILVRDTLNDAGNKTATITMKKISN